MDRYADTHTDRHADAHRQISILCTQTDTQTGRYADTHTDTQTHSRETLPMNSLLNEF